MGFKNKRRMKYLKLFEIYYTKNSDTNGKRLWELYKKSNLSIGEFTDKIIKDEYKRVLHNVLMKGDYKVEDPDLVFRDKLSKSWRKHSSEVMNGLKKFMEKYYDEKLIDIIKQDIEENPSIYLDNKEWFELNSYWINMNEILPEWMRRGNKSGLLDAKTKD
jgi:gas vesicle protein